MGGLGEAICIKLAALGYKVVTTHSPGNTKAKEWLDSMNKMGYGFRAYPCDVADWDSCVACAQKVAADVGPIDVLVNNAGITRDTTFKKMDTRQLGRGDARPTSIQLLQHDEAGLRRRWSTAAGAGSSTSRR